jgi:hypothetical protein
MSGSFLFDDLPDNPPEAAIELARRGYPVFPCHPITKAPLNGDGGHNKATTDLRKVEGWFFKTVSNKGALIGMPTGSPSGLIVLDVDVPGDTHEQNGFASLDVIAEHGFSVPESPLVVQTVSGGRHFYFRRPAEGLRSRNGILPGVDLKADGGYVICPPSRRPDGLGWEVYHG